MLEMYCGGNRLFVINSMSHLSEPSVLSMFDEVWKTLRLWHRPKSRNSLMGFHDGADELALVAECVVLFVFGRQTNYKVLHLVASG